MKNEMKQAKKALQRMLSALALTALFLSLVAGALAEDAITQPAVGYAVAAARERTGSVPLFAEADEGSEVLMRYYSGAQLEVLELAENGMVKVCCGTLEGYMRAGDLRYGALAMRRVRPVTAQLELAQPEFVRSQRDEGSESEETMTFFEVWGMSDTWAQTCGRPVFLLGTWSGQELERAFVSLAGGVAGTEFTEYALATVVPMEGELSYEEAYERGIDLALQNPDELTLIPPEKRTSEGLHALEADLFLTFNFDSGEAMWFAYYSDDEDYEQSFAVRMDAQGNLVAIEVTHG